MNSKTIKFVLFSIPYTEPEYVLSKLLNSTCRLFDKLTSAG